MQWYTDPAFYTGIVAVIGAISTLIAQLRSHSTLKDTNTKVAAIEPQAIARQAVLVAEVQNGHATNGGTGQPSTTPPAGGPVV